MANTILNLLGFESGLVGLFASPVEGIASIGASFTNPQTNPASGLYAIRTHPAGTLTSALALSGHAASGIPANMAANPLYANVSVYLANVQRVPTDVVFASGLPNIVSLTANFNAATDVGKAISDGVVNVPAGTTIASVTDATHAVMSANALGTSAGAAATISALQASNEICRCVSGTNTLKMSVRLTPALKLALYDSTDTLIATGTTVLAVGTRYRIDVKCSNGVASAYELRINGVSELSGTANLAATNNTRFIIGKALDHSSIAGEEIDIYWDDLWLDSGDYAPIGYKIGVMLPASNGATQQWTGGTGASGFAEIAERPWATADYVADPNSGTAVTGLFNLTTPPSSTVYGVKVAVYVSDAAGAVTNTFQFGIRSVSTDSITTNRNTPAAASLEDLGNVVQTDPATSAAWTRAGLEAAQIKIVENTASVSTRTYAAFVYVAYLPVPSMITDTRRVRRNVLLRR